MLYPIMTDIVKTIQDLREQFKSLHNNVDTPKKWKSKKSKKAKRHRTHICVDRATTDLITVRVE